MSPKLYRRHHNFLDEQSSVTAYIGKTIWIFIEICYDKISVILYVIEN